MSEKSSYNLKYSCSICNLETNNIYGLESHVRKHFKDKYFSCLHCPSNFDVLNKLVIHVYEKHDTLELDDFKYSCRYCSLKLRTVYKLIEHEIYHQPENSQNQYKPFDCSNCGDTFISNSLLIYHKKFKCGDRTIICHTCDNKFSFMKDFRIHERLHENLPVYQCKFCSKLFDKLETFSNHIRIKHKYDLNKKQILSIKNGIDKNNSTLIKKLQLTESELKKDIRDSTSDKRIMKKLNLKRNYSCKICFLSFVLERTLDIHYKRNHPDVVISENQNITNNNTLQLNIKNEPEIIDKCLKCNVDFSSYKEFKIHLLNKHNGEKPYKCVVCLLSFTRSTTLYEHYKIHETKYFKCNYCQEILNKHISEKHIKTHKGKYIFKCPKCRIPYSRGKLLEKHGIVHSKDISYSCDFCEKEFINVDEKNKHNKLHRKINIYKCSICGLLCDTQNKLIEHIQLHKNNGYSNKCIICEKVFNYKQNMIAHMSKHIDEKPYQCHICNRTFSFKNTVVEHISLHMKPIV